MATPMISIFSLFFLGSSHVNVRLSHNPVSHPTRGKISDMRNKDGYSLGSIVSFDLTYNITNTVSQSAPTIIPMMRPLSGA